MLKLDIYTPAGKKTESMNLPSSLEAKELNMPIFSQAIHVYRDRAHMGLVKAQTRSEVDRTKKKIYKQKGTGGARHGARSAGIFVGGGKALGPRPDARTRTLTAALKKVALQTALTLKVTGKAALAISDMSQFSKTSEAAKFITAIRKDHDLTDTSTFLFVGKEQTTPRALRNLASVTYVPFQTLTAYHLFWHSWVVFDSTVFSQPASTKSTSSSESETKQVQSTAKPKSATIKKAAPAKKPASVRKTTKS
jgi:large subunit ribosomal protein L4